MPVISEFLQGNKTTVMYERPLIDYPGQLHLLICRFILKLGNYGNIVWAISGACYVGVLVFLAVTNFYARTHSNDRLRRFFYSPFFFAILIGLGIFIQRVPNLILPECNPDESWWISGAASVMTDFKICFQSCWPLVILPLKIINSFGGSLNYATVRLFGLLFCIIPSVLFIYSAFINFFGDKIARIAILPLAVSMAFIQSEDIIAYNSEHVPMVLTAVAVFLYSKTVSVPQKKLIYLSLLGFVLGLVPYAKLQVLPVTLAIGVFVVAEIIVENRHSLKPLSKLLSAFAVSGLIPSLIVLCYLLLFNVFEDFWRSYIVNTIVYAHKGIMGNEGMLLASAILEFFHSITALPDLRYYFEFSGLLFLLMPFMLAIFRRRISSDNYKIVILSVLCVIAGIYGVVKPRNFFGHYLVLIIIPAAFLTGAILDAVYKMQSRSRTVLSIRYLKMLFTVILLSYVIFPALYAISGGSRGISYIKKNGIEAKKSDIAARISAYARPDERMAVWGWEPKYYVETGLMLGTRDPTSQWQITSGLIQDYYLRRYWSDLIKNRPVIFIDAVAPKQFKFTDRDRQGHQQFPIIRQLVDKDYTLVSVFEGVRIYVLNERLKELSFTWLASQKGFSAVAKSFTERCAGENINRTGDDVISLVVDAYLVALYSGQADVVYMLLEDGKLVDTKSDSVSIALWTASQNGHAGVVNRLLEKGVDVNVKSTDEGSTALWAASQNDVAEIVRLLLDKGADVNAKSTDDGSTALWMASQHGYTDVVRLLLEKGADVNVKSADDGSSALWVASKNNYTDIIELLLKNGADINAEKTDDGATALWIASQIGRKDVVRLLLEKGADVNLKRSSDGSTALRTASQRGHTDVVKLLLEKGADANAKSRSGITALMVASQYGRAEVVKLLLAAKADINAKTTIGMGEKDYTALGIAKTTGHRQIVRLLKKAGAKE